MRRITVLVAIATLSVIAQPGWSADSGATPIPDFSSHNLGWAADSTRFRHVAGEKYEPILNDRSHPFCGNQILPQCGGVVTPEIADTTNPILQPWAAAQMKKTNGEILAGKQSFQAMSRCWPPGVPGSMIFTAEPAYFLQAPAEVTWLNSRGQNIRHFYMNQEHSKNLMPTWFGKSVAHYQGDELVVDTVGLNDKSFIDWWHTPHTTKLHVVEEYKWIEDAEEYNFNGTWGQTGRTLQGMVTVDDPGTFTTVWKGVVYYRKHTMPISESESVCAENNDNNYFHEDSVPVPQTEIPDF